MKLKTLVQQTTAIALAWAVIGLSPAAQAGTLHPTGYAVPPAAQFGLSIGGSPHAGAFTGTFNAVPIIFWCAQLDQFFNFGNNYEYTASLPNNATYTLLGQLFTGFYGVALNNSQNSAAFQLAIWEILYDPDLNLTDPLSPFRVTSGNATTVAIAQGWLNNLGNFADSFDVFLLHSDTNQDFITPGPGQFLVPEPAPLLLLGAGLIGMMFMMRRRDRKLVA